MKKVLIILCAIMGFINTAYCEYISEINQTNKVTWSIVHGDNQLPRYDHLGYYRTREGPTETRTGSFLKNFAAGMNKIIMSPARLMSFAYEVGANEKYSEAVRLPTNKKNATKILSKQKLSDKEKTGAALQALYESTINEPIISPHVKRIRDWWANKYEAIDSFWGLDPELQQTTETIFWGLIGKITSVIALILFFVFIKKSFKRSTVSHIHTSNNIPDREDVP